MVSVSTAAFCRIVSGAFPATPPFPPLFALGNNGIGPIIFLLEDFRKSYKEIFPDNKSVAAVTKADGEKWKSIPDCEKAPCVAKAAKRKAEYEIAIKLFTPPPPPPPPPPSKTTKVAPSLGQKEPTFNVGKIEVEKLQENVEAAEERAEPRSSPGLETNAENRTATLGSVEVNNSNNSVYSMNKLVSDSEEIETMEKTLDWTEVVFYHTKGPANVADLGDPGSFDKIISGASHRVQELEEIVDEAGEHLRISEDDAGTEEK
ncbi:high mobility group B protein 3-like [Abeliophyllum distichum]|uniref:High mobility group B protein 3-like n=1 Tax=Abeliophyllum distichum TaxID=126358 RepID=A0ABD1QFE3_9LAMI